jgi:hypothetical protein
MSLTVFWQMIRITADPDWRPERLLFRGQATDRFRTVENFEDCQAGMALS